MSRQQEAAERMRAFVERTRVGSGEPGPRYLWTDAFAVCNLLGLAGAGVLPAGTELARRLVEQVHATLGRHDPAHGDAAPLGARDEASRRRSPTAAGLRIGKPLPERRPDEPVDARLEWERDGQYFHYLTRWMHALARLAAATGEARYHVWAVELADAAFDAFVIRDRRGPRRMVWKMSVDLDRVLVPSMGLHDPLDGWVTSLQLAASRFANGVQRDRLQQQADDYRALCTGGDWSSPDPLGIGGLLVDAWRLWRACGSREHGALVRLLESARAGIAVARREGLVRGAAADRLAFRELGLSIGLHAIGLLARATRRNADDEPLAASLARLDDERWLADAIETTWRNPANRAAAAWRDHRDINEVMLATSLAPAGYLGGEPALAAVARSEAEVSR